MRKVLTRNALLLIGLSALTLVAVTRPALAKKATGIRGAWCGTYLAKTTNPAHSLLRAPIEERPVVLPC